ncbi:hypothetical protein KY317_03600 [Candidatus Woesearchaeota archaeon]|nr:hypothetical protein [Candidatus Woesearchaeota archaeon]
MAKRKKGDLKKVGHYSFLAGIIIAVIVGLVPSLRGDPAIWVMVILGVIVGFLNVTSKETVGFLIACVGLIIASSASALSLAVIWPTLTTILGNMIVFIAPAAIVVAIKTVIALAEG